MQKNERKAPAGILGFPVTPMNSQGRVDVKALEMNIQFLLDAGLKSIFIGCGSGEFHAVDHNEYQTLVEVALSTVKGKASIYTGLVEM